MVVSNDEESLYRFLEEHGNDRLKSGLLLFWGMHPNAKFDKKVICYALDCNKLDAERALRAMVEEGLLDKHICNGLILYSLTTNQERRHPIMTLATLGWDRWQFMLRGIEQRHRVTKDTEVPQRALKLLSKY